MSSAQAKAQALNVELENQARVVLDELDQKHLRKVARGAYACALACYDKAGSSGPASALDHCVQTCQIPHQQANAMVQNVRCSVLCCVGCCLCCRFPLTHSP